MKKFRDNLVIFLIMGVIYCAIEVLWRGHTHISMAIVGGLCGVCIGAVNEIIPWEMGFIWQCLIGASLTTCIEFLSGMILNVWLKLNVWDYSNLPLNLYGQVCAYFFLAWIALAAVGIVFDDYLRYWIFGEEKPHYTLI